MENQIDNFVKNAYISAFDTDSDIIKMLMLVNTKCLIDDFKQRYLFVDNNRLRDELRYYKFYGAEYNGENLLNIFLPVILGNNDGEKCDKELVELVKKYVMYFKIENKYSEYLIATLIYSELIHNLLKNPSIEYDEIMDMIKERVVSLNIDMEKSHVVKFQMYRIGIIKTIDEYKDGKRNSSSDICSGLLDAIFDIYVEDRDESEDINSIKKVLFSLLGQKISTEIENIDFVDSMAEYTVKLKKYKINKKEYHAKANPLEIISLNEGDSIQDPILNKLTVKSKIINGNLLKINVHTKSGEYCFRFAKKS
ncbi:hypothetical protein JHD53_02285 [Peptacetobacter hiranonis]|uniref:hypothetical protein n=1 Tax=Peptacetobacter hiranonis TaxID=89152 RepID=UPI0019175DE0|nr:hypothetical protein [Peptacetobacter hiranonis]QQQ86946.1 hypothetical protein JHD53_02285 [Peptacetobacter hiranonis]